MRYFKCISLNTRAGGSLVDFTIGRIYKGDTRLAGGPALGSTLIFPKSNTRTNNQIWNDTVNTSFTRFQEVGKDEYANQMSNDLVNTSIQLGNITEEKFNDLLASVSNAGYLERKHIGNNIYANIFPRTTGLGHRGNSRLNLTVGVYSKGAQVHSHTKLFCLDNNTQSTERVPVKECPFTIDEIIEVFKPKTAVVTEVAPVVAKPIEAEPYTIMEFRYVNSDLPPNRSRAIYHDGGYKFPDMIHRSGKSSLNLLIEQAWTIWSVRRNSDGEIFSVGDKVDGSCTRNVNITKIKKSPYHSTAILVEIGAEAILSLGDIKHCDVTKTVHAPHPELVKKSTKTFTAGNKKVIAIDEIERILAKHYDKSDVKEILETLNKA